MRYLTMVKGPESAGMPPQALMEAIARLGDEAMKAGVLVETGGLMPSAMGARVRLGGGRVTVTDGPFSETKELIGGYAVYEVKSKEEAVEWCRRFMEAHRENWPGWEGETEIRQVFGPDDFPQ
ncbi:MAG: YciI family protein [Labedaea sp.]